MLVDLAAHHGQGNVKIKDISQRQEISLKYLEQIITILSKAGYVKGERGPQGGYSLSKDPKDITAADIIMLVIGAFLIISGLLQMYEAYQIKSC